MIPLLFLFAWGWLLRGLAPGIAGDDSAELTLAALRLDVLHPPGYPLLALAGRLALAVPLGSPGFRMNLLCGAGCGAGVVVLMFSVARLLLARTGARGTLGPWLAAVLLLAMPATFHQATESEKYFPHLLLALALLRVVLTAGPAPYRPAFAFGVALAHHPQAVLLTPLLWPWRSAVRRLPELALAAALLLLPVSVKVMYPALRAQAAEQDRTLADWGAPRTVGPLARYLTVRQYGTRFSGGATAWFNRLAPQLAAYPEALGTVPLVLAWFGAAGLVRLAPALAGPVLAIVPLSWVFAGSFQLPAHLASANHLVPYAILWLCAAWAASRLPCLLSPAVLLWVALSGHQQALDRLPAEAQDRRFAVWDYNRALLRLAPGNAILLAGMDNDLFPLRYLAGALGERPDLLVLDPPFQTKTDDYLAMVRRVAPGLRLPPVPRNDPTALWHALLHADGESCVVMSGFLEAALPGELRFCGPLAVSPLRPCAALPARDRLPRIWDRLNWRSVRAPGADSPRLRPVTGVYAAALSSSIGSALQEGRMADAAALFAVKRRRFPGEPSTFLEEGALALTRRDPGAAAVAFDRAIAAAPDLLDGYAALALLLEAGGDREGMVRLGGRLARARPDAPGALEQALSRSTRPGPILRAALATMARAEADAMATEGAGTAMRTAALRRLADRLAPGPR